MLRARLSQITDEEPTDNHLQLLEELRASVGHTIEAHESENSLTQFTCGVHAFYLVGDETYFQIASSGLGTTYAGKAFVDFIINQGMLASRTEGTVVAGDLVIYFADEEFRHVGRVLGVDRVLSKWGTGLLLEHALWEVPESYGDRVEYYVGPNEEQSFALFQRYAESRGLKFGEEEA